MKKKDAIWLFAGGTMQEIVSQEILSRGYKLIITDMNKDCYCSKYADELIELDTFDILGNLKEAKRLKKKYFIKAVLTAAADCHETVAVVGKFLKVHVINPNIAHICRYKNLCREVLVKANIPQPKFKIVFTYKEAQNFIKELEGRAVIKATNNSGSRGFSIVNKIEEFTVEKFELALQSGTTKSVLIEEILVPIESEVAEQSVETVWYNGKMYWLNWVDRLFRKDSRFYNALKGDDFSEKNWGVELGHINPALHDYQTKLSVYEMINKAGIALGMLNEKGGHILKFDIMLTKNGPYIIEITPRLSGGWDSSRSTPERGANFVGGLVSLSLNQKMDLPFWHRYFEYKDPNIYAVVLARVDSNAKDCIGRKFSIGTDYNLEKGIQKALINLKGEKYVI